MKYFATASLILISFTLAACQTTVSSPDVKIKTTGGTEIEIKDGDGDSGKFCPPGQAKKGNC